MGAPPVQLPCDISISKYSPDGSKLLFATYMGGDDDEYPHSLCVDPYNNLLIFGTTLSYNFPVHPDSAAFLNHRGDYDIFVNKLSSDGSTLLGGTFIGGNDADGFQTESPFTALVYNYADNYRGDVTTDDVGNIYIATFDSVSHIHNIKVDGSRILLGTHEGLYLYEGPNKMKKLS